MHAEERRRGGLGNDVPALTVARICGSGAEAISVAAEMMLTGRFIDANKLHYIDFDSRFFSVKGPSIVPRPPQGQPLVVALAHSTIPLHFAATSADVVLVTPSGPDDAPRWIADVRSAERDVERRGEPLRILAELVVVLADTPTAAVDRASQLDEWSGSALTSDAEIFVGTPDQLVDLLLAYEENSLKFF
mgnify:CR=1 FL=1